MSQRERYKTEEEKRDLHRCVRDRKKLIFSVSHTTMKVSLLFLCLVSFSLGHTWVSCVNYDVNTRTCSAYIRNYVGRLGIPSNTTVDNYYTNKLLGQNNSFPLCKPDTQGRAIYSSTYPMAHVNAGEYLTLMYTPNGHSDEGDVGRNTSVRIHWNRRDTGPGPLLRTRGELSPANELTRWFYGDRCANQTEENGGDVASLPCPNRFQIPVDTATGIYQMIFYWPYNKVASQNPYGEEYYSCFEVNVFNAAQTFTNTEPGPEIETITISSTTRASSATRTSGTRATSATRTSARSSATRSSTVATSSSTSRPNVIQDNSVGFVRPLLSLVVVVAVLFA
eukprot:TRINITY_DN49_c0_g1_i4.p1 TRINITY_DN49_c0_g1~~TRINITY_DN49_c0_g1_i4.p1  ORF type:complete len:337 (+),score=73.63 TRINITY_DN49_c0_g1_i4:716-1726(+)